MTNEFLTDLFGDQEGIVYSPVKDPKIAKDWHQHFFQWPQERESLERHIRDFDKREVYLSPVLFTEPRVAPETFKGTNYLWTEFDGKVPDSIDTEPTFRILSSSTGHEHWYWKLDEFTTDKVLIEDLTRRIAFYYGADLSAWDYQQVLRPVDTWNHKRNKPVTLLARSDRVYAIEEFLKVPIPPAGTRVDVNLGDLLPRDNILAKYRFTPNALDLLFKTVPQGKRSDALVALAHECIESGLSNEETYVLLEDRDTNWGKFVGRTDRVKRIEGIIASVRRSKASVAEILNDAPEVYRFYDFMQTNIKLKWAIEGLLPVAGAMVVLGAPGIGKSTFSLRLAINLSLGRESFLLWRIVNRQRVLFISLEMQHADLKEFFEDMDLPVDVQQQLQEQFYIWPIGNAYPLDTPDQQIELIKYIKLHKIELIIIDSHSLAMYGSIKDDDDVKRLNSFLNEDVRKRLKCGYLFIHHPRKQAVGEQRNGQGQDDSYGSTFIVANAQTVVVLSARPGSSRIHVKLTKVRHKQGMEDFYIERTPDRGFKLVDSKHADDSGAGISKTTVLEYRSESSDKGTATHPLGKLFGP